jgi:hypothetical protein
VIEFANGIQKGKRPSGAALLPASRFKRTIGWTLCGAMLKLAASQGIASSSTPNQCARTYSVDFRVKRPHMLPITIKGASTAPLESRL